MLALCLVSCLTLASVLAIAAQSFTDVATEEELFTAVRSGGGNVRLIVQSLADGCDGYAAFFRQILQGRHLLASFRG